MALCLVKISYKFLVAILLGFPVALILTAIACVNISIMDDFTKTLLAAVAGGLMVLAGQYIHDQKIRVEGRRKRG